MRYTSIALAAAALLTLAACGGNDVGSATSTKVGDVNAASSFVCS